MHYDLRDAGNLVKAGTYIRISSHEKKQMFKCKICGKRFSDVETTGHIIVSRRSTVSLYVLPKEMASGQPREYCL